MTIDTINTKLISKYDDYFVIMIVKHSSTNYQLTNFFGYVHKCYENRIVLHSKHDGKVLALSVDKNGEVKYYRRSDKNQLKASLKLFKQLNQYTSYIINIVCEDDNSNRYNVIHPKSDMMWSISNNIAEITQRDKVINRFKIQDTDNIGESGEKLMEATNGSNLSVSYINQDMTDKFLEAYNIITKHRDKNIDINGFQIESKEPFMIKRIFDF